MDFKLIKDGKTFNIIHADNEDFVREYAHSIGATYEKIIVPEPESVDPPPTELEQLRADVDFLAAIGGVEL